MVQDYRPEIRVLKGFSIANVVLSALSIAGLLVCLIFCGIGIAGVAYGTSTYSASGYDKVISLQDPGYYDYQALDVGNAPATLTASDPWSGTDGLSDDDLEKLWEEYLGGNNTSGSDDTYLSPQESELVGVAAISVIVLVMVFIVFGLAVSVFCLITAIMILRAKDDVTYFKRFFVMSIVAASLCLITGGLITMTLFILTAVWIHKVRAKAGQLQG